MQNESVITLRLQLSRRTALYTLTAFFLCWRPSFLGSEILTLTTYYPAPYGGYAALLTTGGEAGPGLNTLLARDFGKVGIGLGAAGKPKPYAILDINTTANSLGSQAVRTMDAANGGLLLGYQGPTIQGRTIADGDGDLSLNGLGGNVGIGTLTPSQKLDVNGNAAFNNGADFTGALFFRAGGEGETLRLTGDNGVNMHLENINGSFRLVNHPWTLDVFNVNQNGDVRVQGTLTNLCRYVDYGNGVTWCGANERIFGWAGDGTARVTGWLPTVTGGDQSNVVAGQWVTYGQDWNGRMQCCRIN
ncbi:MAG: hypothetical protein WCW52_07795 [Elusimicrobiales bacterium]|jgi:hypothetical protein